MIGLIATLAAMPATGFAGSRDGRDVMSAVCRDNQQQDAFGNPCPRPSHERLVLDAKTAAANAYHLYLAKRGSKEAVERAEYTLSKLSGETIGQHDWSLPDDTPAALRLLGQEPPRDYGPLNSRFWPFEQITWWYCGPATAESILWYLGPHQSQTVDPESSGRPWLTGNPYEDQPLLAKDFWLATDRYGGTNWGQEYFPHTLNAWRGNSWYVQSATANAGGDLTKEQALINLRYDVDRSYPVAENVLYAPSTYYPFGFWPGIVYMHWDVVYGSYDDNGTPYVRIGQVYRDERVDYQRFQSIAWDVHWSAIEKWHGIVW